MENDRSRHFTSRVIEDLDAKIRLSNSNSDRNVLFARKAFALARFSLVQDARNIIGSLREVNQSFETRLSAWIMFAEGIIEHSANLDVAKSKDRVLRAHLVGQVANDPTLAGTSAAWLAFFCFQQGRYVETKDYLVKAFSWTKNEDSEGRSRACLVMGMGFLYAGEFKKGQMWMQLARANAVKSGDIAMQNIIFFNSSAYHAARLTLLDCTSTVDPEELNFALMSAQSSSNLNTALGILNQVSLIPIQRAELLTIEKKWNLAVDLFDQYLAQAKDDGQSPWIPKFIAQRAWCKANLADKDGAISDIEQAIALSAQCIDPDDRAVLHLRVSSTAKLLGDNSRSAREHALGEQHLSLFHDQQALVLSYFKEVAEAYPQN